MKKINWYPGHMKKTQDLIESYIRQVDVVVELVDARIPRSSKNPLIENLLKKYQKKQLLVFTKSDLIDMKKQSRWEEYYSDYNYLYVDIFNEKSRNQILKSANDMMQEQFAIWKRKGLRQRAVRIMIVGVPNVGKSTLINKFSKKNSAKTGNMPGLTRNIQWINVNKNIELLDMPGILWPKIDDIQVGYNLAVCNCIKNEILDVEDITKYLIKYLKVSKNKYFLGLIEDLEKKDFQSIIDFFCTKYNFKINDENDEHRLYNKLLKDFNEAKFGNIVLDNYEIQDW